MLPVVLQQHGKYLLVKCLIPLVAVVAEQYILLRLLVLRSHHLHAVESHRAGAELIGAAESLAPVHHSLYILEAQFVELLHLVEVELALEIPRRVLVSLNPCLVRTLLVDDAYGVDALVHTDGVLPIVGALRILRVVFDAYSLVGTHVAYHDVLLDAPDLCSRRILGIAHLLDAIA